MLKSAFTILTSFLLDYAPNEPVSNVEDTTNYVAAGSANSKVSGIITAGYGSKIFYQDEDYDAPSINRSITDNINIDLPVNSQSQALLASYRYIYSIRMYDEVLGSIKNATAPVASPFSTIALSGDSTNYVSAITTLLSQGAWGTIKVYFYNSSSVKLAEAVLTGATYGASKTTLTFNSTTYSGFASIAKVRIVSFYSLTADYDYSQVFPTPALNAIPNYPASQLTVQDLTEYPASATIDSKLLTIQYPNLANGTPASAAVTSTDGSLTIGPNVFTGTYTCSIVTQMTFTETDGLVVRNTIYGFLYPSLQATDSLCGLSMCILNVRTRYKESFAVGNNSTFQLLNYVVLINFYISTYWMQIDCGNFTGASETLAQLLIALNDADCNCSSSDNTSGQPTEIWPLYVDPLLSYVPKSWVEQDAITTNSNSKVVSTKAAINYLSYAQGNTASGTGSATLNQKTGLITYSTAIAANSPGVFTLTNDKIGERSYIMWEIVDYTGSNGYPVRLSEARNSGSVIFNLFNLDSADDTNQSIKIAFTILDSQ